MAKNVTAFVLDRERVQASEDGMTVPPLPGLWTNEKPIHPEALGITLGEMRDLVEALSLPLVEVSVSESKAAREFARPDYLAESAPLASAPVDPYQAVTTETPDEDVPPAAPDVERARLAADETENAGEDA
jgi:hypothetical protein